MMNLICRGEMYRTFEVTCGRAWLGFVVEKRKGTRRTTLAASASAVDRAYAFFGEPGARVPSPYVARTVSQSVAIIILFAIRQLQMYPIKTHTQIARTSKINTPYLIIIRFSSSSKNPSPFCSWKYLSYPNVTLLGIYQSIST